MDVDIVDSPETFVVMLEHRGLLADEHNIGKDSGKRDKRNGNSG